MTITVRVTLDELILGRLRLTHAVPLEEVAGELGRPDRSIAAGSPAPYGHRSNQIHLYDELGVFLNEHHARRLIEEVTFVFDPSCSAFPPSTACSLDLRVDDCALTAETTLRELRKGSPTIRQVLGRHWSAEGNLHVGIAVVAGDRIGEISIGLSCPSK